MSKIGRYIVGAIDNTDWIEAHLKVLLKATSYDGGSSGDDDSYWVVLQEVLGQVQRLRTNLENAHLCLPPQGPEPSVVLRKLKDQLDGLD